MPQIKRDNYFTEAWFLIKPACSSGKYRRREVMKRSILSNSLAQLNLIEMETDEILKYLNKYLLLRCQYVFKYVFKIYF